MNRLRWQMALFVVCLSAATAGLLFARSYLPIAWYVGGTYDVLFSKGFGVEFLARFAYTDATLLTVEGGFACFSDELARIEAENPGEFVPELDGQSVRMAYHRQDGGLCVRASQISALSLGGWRVWGTMSAGGTPSA